MDSTDDEYYIPNIITETYTGVSFRKGRFLGKGGFSKCYKITDIRTGNIYAGKVISKKFRLSGSEQMGHIIQEIQIHRSLDSKHVVEFYGSFEDNYNIYIVLELCQNRSMMELQKRRKALTEPEVRYFMQQIVLGVNYLHQHKVIHRDLKLGNLLLNDNLDVKIADFGIATKIEYDGEMKKNVCGTLSYIAPEVIAKTGHSYEVDVWSLGCIMHTLLVGKSPFSVTRLKKIYPSIKPWKCNLLVQSNISKSAVSLINHMLQEDPKCRPKVSNILKYKFFRDVQLHPALWDNRDTDYSDKMKRENVWREVMSLMYDDGVENWFIRKN